MKYKVVNPNKYSGCFLGLAIGDALGAPFEGGFIERLLWKIIGKTKDGKYRYTDDTQMSIDLANSLVLKNGLNQEHLAAAFAKNYKWSRGYGPSAAWLLKKINNGAKWQEVNCKKFKAGSFGNGAAMRAPILAMCFLNNQNLLNENIIKASEITHAHPLAIEGARLIAFATYAALHNWNTEAIIEALPNWCKSGEYQLKIAFCIKLIQTSDTVTETELIIKLGNGIAASESSVTAVYFALKYRNRGYNDMLAQIYNLGGDTDTIGAMAGAIWGAFHGIEAIEESKIQLVENSAEIFSLSEQLYAISSKL